MSPRVNYEETIWEAMRSAGQDNDDKGLDWRTMNVMATVRVIVEHKVTVDGTVLQEDVRPISVYVRHGCVVRADQLDKDMTEYEVRPVRLVNLCTDRKTYRFRSLKVGLMKCKTRSEMGTSEQDTWKIREFSKLGGSAVAEFVSGACLDPYEKLDDETDVANDLSDLGLYRQTPCIVTKFKVQRKMAEVNYLSLGAFFFFRFVQRCGRVFRLRFRVNFGKTVKGAEQHNRCPGPEENCFPGCHSSQCLPSLSHVPDHLSK